MAIPPMEDMVGREAEWQRLADFATIVCARCEQEETVVRLFVTVMFVSLGFFAPADRLFGIQHGPVHWAPELEWRIGGLSEEAPLEHFSAVTVGPDGTAYLGQPSSPRIWAVHADGTFTRFGRDGEGPGELRSIGSIVVRPGQLLAIDFRLRRVVAMDAAGGHIDTRSLGWAYALTRSDAMVPFGDGLLVRRPADGAGSNGANVLTTVDWEGSEETVLTRLPPGDPLVRISHPGGEGSISRGVSPFRELILPALDPAGDLVAVLDQQGANNDTAVEPQVRVFYADGRAPAEFSVRRSSGVPVEDEDLQEAIRPLMEHERLQSWFPSTRARREVVSEAFGVGRYWPPVRRMVIGTDERIWLLRESAAPGMERWEAWDATGRLRGVLHASSDAHLLAFGEDHAWGREEGQYGVPYLVKYRLVQVSDPGSDSLGR